MPVSTESAEKGKEQMAFTLPHGFQSIVRSPIVHVDTLPARRGFLPQSPAIVGRWFLALPPQRLSLPMHSLLVGLTLIIMAIAAPRMAAQRVEVSIDASNPGVKIDRNLFGQFAGHLGHGIYDGIWVGSDSAIPNTRGIRNDVVAALKAIHVPNVRWPGGCFADGYHWRDGIGAQRGVRMNPDWGGVIEPNTFGTHEFMDFIDQIDSEAYLSVNLGSGSPQEA